MIQFLQAHLAVLFALVPLVVLLHLFARKPTPMTVPSLLLWTSTVQHTSAARRQVRWDLLLLLQVLAVTLLVLALLQPQLPLDHGTHQLVLILDGSASMQAEDILPNRFAAAVNAAVDYVERAQAKEIALLFVGTEPRLVEEFTQDKDAIIASLRRLEPTRSAGDVQNTLERASALLESSQGRMVFFTDGAWEGNAPRIAPLDIVQIGTDAANYGITKVAARARSHGSYDVFVQVGNFSAYPQDMGVAIKVTGNLLEATMLTVPPNETMSTVFTIPVETKTRLDISIEAPGVLALDNQASLTIDPRRQRVLLVTPGNFFLERALLASAQVRLFSQTRPPDDPNAYDLVIYDRIPASPQATSGLFIQTHPSHLSLEQGPSPIRTIMANRVHPLLHFVDSSDWRVAQSYTVPSLPGHTDVLLESDAGAIAVTWEDESSKGVFLGFDLSESNLPLQVAFPILIGNVLDWLTTDGITISPVIGASESDVRPRTTSATWPTSAEQVEQAVQHWRGIWRIFGWFALVLLLGEWYLHRRKGYHLSQRFPLLGSLLRALCLVLLVLSLIGVSLPTVDDRQTVFFVVDGSLSVPPEQEQQALRFVQEALATKAADYRAAIIRFGAEPIVQQPPSFEVTLSQLASVPRPDFTDIGRALQAVLDFAQPETNHRVVLLSDGQENRGSAMQLVPRMVDANIPIDVVELLPTVKPEVLISDLVVPTRVGQAESFATQVFVESTDEAEGVLRLLINDQTTKARDIHIAPGTNVYSFVTELNAEGFHQMQAVIDSEHDTLAANNTMEAFTWVSGYPSILVVSKPDDLTPELTALIADRGYAVDHRSLDQFPTSLAELQSYQVTILNDIPAYGLSRAQLSMITNYVQDFGGGLITIGGTSSYAMGEYAVSPLETILPVYSRVEKIAAFPTLSLVLILDKSGSMRHIERGFGGMSRMDIAKLAAVGVVDLLLARERIGVLAFDTATEWVVPLQDAGNRQQILATLDAFDAGTGGTAIYPSLVEAFAALVEEDSDVRHVILLSDGISMPGDFDGIMAKYQEQGISLTSVGVGAEADLQLLSRLAQLGGGRSFYTTDFRSIPQILASEALLLSASPIIEEPTNVVPVALPQPLADISWEDAPPLDGFLLTTAKDQATVALMAEDNSPLLASQRFGLGRTVAFTSDLGQTLAASWNAWPQRDDFYTSLIQLAISDIPSANLYLQFVAQHETGKLVAHAMDSEGQYVNFLPLQALVHSPDGEVTEWTLHNTGPGLYQAEVPLEQVGVYIASVKNQSAAVVKSYSPEYRLPRDTTLLADLAARTRGRWLTDPQDVFAEPMTARGQPRDISIWLVACVLGLFMLELVLRTLLPPNLTKPPHFRRGV